MRKKEPVTLSLCTFRDIFAERQALEDVKGERPWKSEAFALGSLLRSEEAKARFPIPVLFSQRTYKISDSRDLVSLFAKTLEPNTKKKKKKWVLDKWIKEPEKGE